jgi:hypothetical protein
MKATLEFQLPEEQEEFDAANQGRDFKLLVWDIDQHLRNLVKHGTPTEAERKMAETLRTMIRESRAVIE